MNFKFVFIALIVFSLSFTSAQAVDVTLSIAPILVEPQIPSVAIAPVLVDPILVSIAPILVEPQIPSVAIAPIFVEEEPNNNNNNNNNNGGSGGGNNNEEESNGQLFVSSPSLEELETTPSSEVSDREGSPSSSWITGAVTGLFGKNALGVGILIVVIGVVGLVVYNRQRFGLVKTQ